MATRSLHTLRILADEAFEPKKKIKKPRQKNKDSFIVFALIVRV